MVSDQAEIWYTHGNLLLGQQRPEAAIASYDKAIVFDSNHPDAHTNRGNALLQLKRYTDAIASFDAAITTKPDHAMALHNRGNAFLELRHPAEAVASYDQAIAFNPNIAETHAARGNALWELRRPEEALTSFQKAADLKPDNADAHWNVSLCLLQMGRFEQGWRLFEWRKRLDRHAAARSYPRPLWPGQYDIAGKTLFIYWEQGLGDTIQFYRYAKLVELLGVKVIMEVQPALHSLLKPISASIQLITPDQQPPEFDFHCPLLSLPLALGTKLETIPSERRYLWATEAQRVRWAIKLGTKTKPRIGVVWSGSLGHRHDHNRSIRLAACLPLFDVDADWICLQKEIREGDLVLARQTGRLALFGDEIDDFSDTAALVEQMDLVITVDTSVAHLAAAMGKPVWILLPYSPDWRWLLDRDDSPWYPTVKLFRQREFRDWASVIDQVMLALRKAFNIPAIR
jgi:tetratricopeptide (TPR) repeat protein